MNLLNLAIIAIAITQSLAIGLGVGAATLAVVNFFLSIKDGVIDAVERRMMKAVYTVVYVAMVLILIATGALTTIQYMSYGTAYFIPFVIMLWILIAMLFINAVLMRTKVMPSSIGPALQVATWYSLALMLTFLSLGLYNFSLKMFTEGYIVVIVLAILIVNGLMMWFEKRAQAASVLVPDAHSAVTPPAVTVSETSTSAATSEQK